MTRSCSEQDCESPAVARGMCSLHYQRYRYRGQLDEVAPARPKACGHCEKSFDPKLRRWGAVYCSKQCNDAARYERKRATAGVAAENCLQCGKSLEGKRADARFCSGNCSQNWRNARRSEQLRETKALRKPCHGCGGPIPAERKGHALYCSDECKSRARRHQSYGLTKQELDFLLAQHERCAICDTEDWGKKGPQVDHSHDTGHVRGILCLNCNNGLGRFFDNVSILESAIAYLKRK